YGVAGCTGCGRCVKVCPVNIDIRDVVERLAAQRPAAPVGAARPTTGSVSGQSASPRGEGRFDRGVE
ncbi:4Fe-4S dicluster domain-containing protein, partial [candidate division WOR-3 bacterium]|nr:4Fe-4S dicluster domain-containing protein [candidate division WOR-3 bacterium]